MAVTAALLSSCGGAKTTTAEADKFDYTVRVLRYGGRFTLVHRAERLADVLCAMRSHGIEPKRLRFLAKSPDAAPSLLFVEGKRGGKSGLVIEPPLVPNGEEWDAVYFRK